MQFAWTTNELIDYARTALNMTHEKLSTGDVKYAVESTCMACTLLELVNEAIQRIEQNDPIFNSRKRWVKDLLKYATEMKEAMFKRYDKTVRES